MLTKLTVRNFKRFSEVEIELGSPVVFVGPNNSGKTSAMQALALWEVGLRRWNERRSAKSTPERRPGVTVGRRDLVAVPVPHARLLWHGLAVRAQDRVQGRRNTYHIYMDVIVEGVADTGVWRCGLEFYYANEESFYCRPLRLGGDRAPQRMPIPPEAAAVRFCLSAADVGASGHRDPPRSRCCERSCRGGAHGRGPAQSFATGFARIGPLTGTRSSSTSSLFLASR